MGSKKIKIKKGTEGRADECEGSHAVGALFASFTWLEAMLFTGSFSCCHGVVRVCPGCATFAVSAWGSVGACLALGGRWL